MNKTNTKKIKNVRLYAKKNGNHSMSIYIDLSGRREFLMTQRGNLLLHRLLQGIRLEELKRLDPVRYLNGLGFSSRDSKRRNSHDLSGVLKHILAVTEDYLLHEYVCDAGQRKPARAPQPQWRSTAALAEECGDAA